MHRQAYQRVYAWIRHMHREHCVHPNHACALPALFVEHTFHCCFGLCRWDARNAQLLTNAVKTTL